MSVEVMTIYERPAGDQTGYSGELKELTGKLLFEDGVPHSYSVTRCYAAVVFAATTVTGLHSWL